jgi:hypothetical protein
MRASLRSEPVQQVNLFAFLDIVFTATGVLMVIGVFFSLSPRLEKLTREPEQSVDTLARQQELQAAIKTWRQNEALEKQIRRFATLKPSPETLAIARDNPVLSFNTEALLLDEAALAANNRPLSQQIAELEAATLRRLAAASKAEKVWLQREQMLLERERRNRRLIVRVDQAPSVKEVVLLVVTDKWIDVERMDRPDLRLRTVAPWAELTRANLLSRFDPARQRFLVFFKPSGAAYFENLRTTLKQAGYEVGYEPVPEGFSVNLHDQESPIQMLR